MPLWLIEFPICNYINFNVERLPQNAHTLDTRIHRVEHIQHVQSICINSKHKNKHINTLQITNNVIWLIGHAANEVHGMSPHHFAHFINARYAMRMHNKYSYI